MSLNKLAMSLILLILSGCSSAQKDIRNPLYEQILTPRAGHANFLTNMACVEWKQPDGGECLKYEVAEYDLNDNNLRKALNDFTFACNIGGRLFKICQDKPGFCRHTYAACGFLHMFSCKTEEYVPVEKYQYLLDAGTKCWSATQYGYGL